MLVWFKPFQRIKKAANKPTPKIESNKMIHKENRTREQRSAPSGNRGLSIGNWVKFISYLVKIGFDKSSDSPDLVLTTRGFSKKPFSWYPFLKNYPPAFESNPGLSGNRPWAGSPIFPEGGKQTGFGSILRPDSGDLSNCQR